MLYLITAHNHDGSYRQWVERLLPHPENTRVPQKINDPHRFNPGHGNGRVGCVAYHFTLL